MSEMIDMDAVAFRDVDGNDVTVRDIVKMNEDGKREEEYCPYCDFSPEIPVVGGICPGCGHWLVPCGMCDSDIVNCNKCIFEGFRPEGYRVTDLSVSPKLSGPVVMHLFALLQEEGMKYMVSERETGFHIYVQSDDCTVQDRIVDYFLEGEITNWGESR